MRKRGHHDVVIEEYHINISANTNTLKSVLTLEDGYQVDFNHQNSIAKVLRFTNTKCTRGFHESENVVNILSINSILFTNTKCTRGFHESENVVNILSINSILVNIHIIPGSYVNGRTRNTIYSFFPNALGYKIVESPVNLAFLPLRMDVINNLGV